MDFLPELTSMPASTSPQGVTGDREGEGNVLELVLEFSRSHFLPKGGFTFVRNPNSKLRVRALRLWPQERC